MKKYALLSLLLLLPLACSTPRKAQPPQFSELDLVGGYHRAPVMWDAQRFAPHVSYTDETGSERWLCEAFLFIEGHDDKRDRNLGLGPFGLSAGKESWEEQLDIWLGPEGDVAALDAACAAVAERIGAPSHKRYVVLTIPDAIMLERFSDKQSSTRYWGAVDGEQLDFAEVEGQLRAYRWYIDTAREMFQSLNCSYLELAGFYILSEELHLSYGETPEERLNHQYKRWESIVPAVAAYCHAAGQGLYWIPYHLAPGYRYWQQLGFDMAWMQPNWYWDLYYGDHPFDKTLDAIQEYGMGMELEFEYSAVRAQMQNGQKGPDGSGKLIFTEADVPALQDRLRTYLRNFREAGLYGRASIAIYSGSNALTQLAQSPYPEDQALYRELCEFILNNPLRHE